MPEKKKPSKPKTVVGFMPPARWDAVQPNYDYGKPAREAAKREAAKKTRPKKKG